MPKPAITIVGSGNLAAVLGPALYASGYKVSEIASRNIPDSLRRARKIANRVKAKTATLDTAEAQSDITWICVADSAIAEVATRLALREGWRGKTVLHSSGALSSEVLAPLRAKGAVIASVHPMMTFVPGVAPDLSTVTFGVEGDPAALRKVRRIVRDLGGRAISVRNRDKVLYHAWGAFASPLIIAELAAADSVAAAIGLSASDARKTVAPILRRTIENYINGGPAAAFSGPIIRGDVETVTAHLQALKRVPQARRLYVELLRTALQQLPSRKTAKLRGLLRKQK